LVIVIARSSLLLVGRFVARRSVGSDLPPLMGNKRPPPPGEGPVGLDGLPSLAAFSSSPSGLPPGAGNEADQAKKAEADEPKQVAKGEVVSGDRLLVPNRHATAVRRDDDGDQVLARVLRTHDLSPG
jgi:hypothetical protein